MANEYDSLLVSFIAESLEMLNNAENSILKLEQEFEKGTVNDIFRAFHTIKGDSGIFGLQDITDLAHAMESMLDHIRNEQLEVTLESIDLLLTGVDRLRRLINAINNGDVVEIQDLIAKLHAALEPKETNMMSDHEKTPAPPAAQSILKQTTEHQGSGKIALRIPKEFRQMAEMEDAYLSLIFLDLYKQEAKSLLEIRQMIEQLEDSGALLMQGVLEHKLPGFSGSGAGAEVLIPYYFLLKTAVPVEEFMERHRIQGRILKRISAPGTYKPKQAAPLSENELPVHDANGNLIGGFFKEDSAAQEQTAAALAEAPVMMQEEPEMSAPEAAAAPATAQQETPAPLQQEAPAEVSQYDQASMSQSTISGSAAAAVAQEGGETHLKVHVDLLDELINLAGETIIARNDLMQKVEKFKDTGLAVTTKKVSYLVSKLQESIMRTRLQEISTIFQRLPRLVRDLCQLTGKKVNLITDGGDVELDKTLIDAIMDPVMHMVRNSIDHGIESPEERKSLGKPETGILKMKATLHGGNVVMQIIDDGRGLNVERIKQKAVEKKLITDRQAAEMEEEDIFDLVFEPGFSTAQTITTTSGRGVGMDVVRTNFKRVGGTVDIASEKGKGTTVTATLPQTLSIITCLLVRIADKLYALPQQNIESLLQVEQKYLSKVEDHLLYELRGHLLPLVDIADVLYPEKEAGEEAKNIAVVRSDRHRFGLLINQIVNPEEIVVKPLGEHFSDLTLFSGAAIMGDGEAVLILDVPGIARFTNLQSNLREELEAEALQKAQQSVDMYDTGYLMIGIANKRFALPVNAAPRIERIKTANIELFMGFESIIFNKEIVPLVHLERMFELGELAAEETVHILIFDTNNMRVAILADEIFNVVDNLPYLDECAYLGESVLGQTIINDRETVVLDVLDLIQRLQESRYRDFRQYLEKEQSKALKERVANKE